jgi:hypothetical protein
MTASETPAALRHRGKRAHCQFACEKPGDSPVSCRWSSKGKRNHERERFPVAMAKQTRRNPQRREMSGRGRSALLSLKKEAASDQPHALMFARDCERAAQGVGVIALDGVFACVVMVGGVLLWHRDAGQQARPGSRHAGQAMRRSLCSTPAEQW